MYKFEAKFHLMLKQIKAVPTEISTIPSEFVALVFDFPPSGCRTLSEVPHVHRHLTTFAEKYDHLIIKSF